MGEFDTLLMHVFDKRFTLSCFSNLFVEFFFVRAHMTLAEMACPVFHFICGIPPGGSF